MAAVMMASEKICCTCGKDVSNLKRMKDSSTGRYWCYDCGVRQPGAKQQSISCPICRKPMSAHSMYRVNDQYICHDCHESRVAGKSDKKVAAGRNKLLTTMGLVAVVAAASAYFNGWI